MASAVATVRESLHSARRRLPELLAPGARLVVGFSGGQDSTCLLHALHTFQPWLELLAVHVDHGLRSDSASSAHQAAELSERIGVRIAVQRVDVPAYRKGQSVEQAARAARYQILAAEAQRHGADAVFVAHTADDQAETLLLNLLRGTGLRGLGAMRLDETLQLSRLGPKIEGLEVPETVRVARPLLEVERATTQAYCAEIGLPVVEDASNQSRAYTRNRVRLDLLPVLERFNPAIRTVLARTATSIGDDVSVLDEIVLRLHDTLARMVGKDRLAYDLASFSAQPRALQRRLLRYGLGCLLGTLEDVAAAPIEDALAMMRSSRAGATYHLPYGVELMIGEDEFELRRYGGARRRINPSNNWGSDAPRV